MFSSVKSSLCTQRSEALEGFDFGLNFLISGRNPNHSEPDVGWMSLSISHAKRNPCTLGYSNESGIDSSVLSCRVPFVPYLAWHGSSFETRSTEKVICVSLN